MFVPHLFPMTVFTLAVAAVKMCVSYRDGSIRLGGLREALCGGFVVGREDRNRGKWQHDGLELKPESRQYLQNN